MATTGRSDEPAAPASDVAAACRDAGLVRLVGAQSGDALAAVGLLGRALSDADVPFQARLLGAATQDLGATDADCTIAVCRPDLPADHAVEPSADESAGTRATTVAGELGATSPTLGLASALASGAGPDVVTDVADAAGLERRPGVAVPTDDLADGLAHSTLVHTSFSGDLASAEDALADLDLSAAPTEADHRRVASLVALAVAEAEDCPPQATRAVERVLHPYAGGPVETVGGYADVLDALARTDPGLGIAVALGRVEAEAGLESWRDHGRRVHDAVANAGLERHDGVVVAHADAPDGPTSGESGQRGTATLVPVGRLVRDYRSPEPTVLLSGTDGVVLTTVDDVNAADLLADAITEVADEPVVGDAATATAPITDGHDAVVEATRRALR